MSMMEGTKKMSNKNKGFRLFYKSINKYVETDGDNTYYLATDGMVWHHYYNQEYHDYVFEDITANVIVEWYADRQDKNDKPIYQGDTVKAYIYGNEEPQILDVIYRNGGFVIDYEDSESDTVLVALFDGIIEIIGTIHDETKGASGE